MKVYNYLEWCLLNQKEYVKEQEMLNLIATLEHKKSHEIAYWTYRKIQEFYSQKFRPEMIVEYFEGWECMVSADFDTYENTINTLFNILISNEWITYESMKCNFTIVHPENLNDFIRDCQRAGIELQWRVK